MCNLKPKSIDTSFITLKYPSAKWIVLPICCYVIFTNTYCNNLVSLQQPLLQQYNLSNLQYNVLFSVYSMPNIILPILGGILIDKLNAEICLILFITLELIGQFLFSLGMTMFHYSLIVIGRIFYGLGGECVHVATYALIGIYFDGSYIAFAIGLRQSMALFGSSSNDFFTDIVLTNTNCISCTVWIGFFSLIIALILVAIMYILILHYNSKIYIIRKAQHYTIPVHSTSLVSYNSIANTPSTLRSQRSQSNREARELSYSSTIPINYGTVPYSMRTRRSAFRLRDIHDFNSLYWLLNICCSVMYVCTVCWNNIAQNEFMDNFKRTYSQTDQLLTEFFVITGICSPLIGIVADKIGHRSQLIIFCGVLLLVGHFFIYSFDHFNDLGWLSVGVVFILGIGFSIFPAVIFPGIAIIVRKKTYGTAYGLVIATFNTILTVAPIIIAILTTDDYKHVEIFMMTMASFSIMIGFLLIFYDRKSGSKLRISSIKRRKRNLEASNS
eukprot:446957_1